MKDLLSTIYEAPRGERFKVTLPWLVIWVLSMIMSWQIAVNNTKDDMRQEVRTSIHEALSGETQLLNVQLSGFNSRMTRLETQVDKLVNRSN
jgi:hypothetical protein